jgi:hypothetical protein
MSLTIQHDKSLPAINLEGIGMKRLGLADARRRQPFAQSKDPDEN